MKDAKIRQLLGKRDPRALDLLAQSYSRLLWVIASSRLPKAQGFNSHDIEDCITDSLLELWENPGEIDEKGPSKDFSAP